MKGKIPSTSYSLGEKPVINEPYAAGVSVMERKPSPMNGNGGRSVDIPVRKTTLPTSTRRKTQSTVVSGPRVTDDNKQRLKEGVRLFGLKQWEEAMQELLFVDPIGLRAEEKIELSYYLGLCFTKLGRSADAMPYLEKVVAACDDPLRVYQCRMALAYIHVTTGRPKMAEYELKRLLDSGFESAMIFNTMAYAAYTRKHYRHAIEYYEKALKLEDDNATALNSMGYILVDTGIDPLKGLKFCRRAVEIQPANAAYLDSLGWACYKCREPTAAKNWLRKALDIAPQESTIREHIRIVTGGAV